jgi:hypothetical protein
MGGWSFRLREQASGLPGASIRDAEIPPDEYYPPGYKPELIPFWPTSKPIFIPQTRSLVCG